MDYEIERQIIRKAMAFDLLNLLDQKPEEETYSVEEIKKMICKYVNTET